MPASPTPPIAPASQPSLGMQARLRWVRGLIAGLPALTSQLQEVLAQQAAVVTTQREMQERREAWAQYRQHQQDWLQACSKALENALRAAPAAAKAKPAAGAALSFELISDDVVDNKILASRMALTMGEVIGLQFEALRVRTQLLEGRELPATDILRAETVCLLLVEQWLACGLARPHLQRIAEPLQTALSTLMLGLYTDLHALYDHQGITRSQDVAMRVRRQEGPASTRAMAVDSAVSPAVSSTAAHGPDTWFSSAQLRNGQVVQTSRSAPASQNHAMAAAGQPAGVAMLARARQRAQDMVIQLRRLLGQPGIELPGLTPGAATGMPAALAPPASAALAQALLEQRIVAQTQYQHMMAQGLTTVHASYGPQDVAQVVGLVRERSVDWKKKATSSSEKATIEVVALMFQSILTEDRIPPSVRVWFARLQVPVLRVALAEPEFFSNLRHPARSLIDRMGSCVMGFDASSINGSALETEIRRIVQVIEQYPETGQKVFALVLREFEDFLARYLTREQATSRIASVAQQVEQKETLAIQYTIELRNLLTDMPVREEIREFLFKLWTDVLAMSTVRYGDQDSRTLRFRQAASELVWAASAKPTRQERAKVIQTLPALLQTLREGLSLTGLTGDAQSARVKQLTDTLAEAFVSKTAAISPARIEAMSQRLAHLEQYISEDGTLQDAPLSPENIEMLLGVDTADLYVIASNQSAVDPSMLEWAMSLAPGRWFTLDHNQARVQVQYVWRSRRGQLHLFAALDGRCYLMQLQRMAAYLQTGLLSVHDEEALTVRATRDALQKIQANPERLRQ